MGWTKDFKKGAKGIGKAKTYKPISNSYNHSAKWTEGAYTTSKKGTASAYKDTTKKSTWAPVGKVFGANRGSTKLGGDGSFDMFDGDPFNNFDPLGGISGKTGLLGMLTSPAVIMMGVGGIMLVSVVL